ncbi:hypothetical protein JCM24511_03014 [Saitozyma sp. JCM 24511]|nr:hypothetical protein JCM24511_03014 [Saitozyma sp. JCM 24511]
MSGIPASLRPAARSAYREVLRAARVTFQGDAPRRLALTHAVRQTFSSPTLTPPSQSQPSASASSSAPPRSAPGPAGSTASADPAPSPEELAKRIEEWREVAVFLRRNVVQGVKDEEGAYRLRVTEHTELGDNASIRDASALPVTPFPNRNRNRRRKSSDESTAS